MSPPGLRVVVAVMGLAVTARCGDFQDARYGAAAGAVQGVVSYTGGLAGALNVGAFTTFPPVGAPLAKVSIAAPSFPQPYVIDGLPAGRYFVLGIIDVDATDGERYHPLIDAGGAFGAYGQPTSLAVSWQDGARDVDIALVDPAADSPWASGRYH